MPEIKKAAGKEASSKDVVSVDPSLWFDRELKYKEKHSGWYIFQSLYWGVYLFALGLLLIGNVGGVTLTPLEFLGWALVMGALFYIVYGFVISLHLKLMKIHG
ncbi:MAG: hypothetical protein ACP5LP_01915 [Candidatus Micrarchaeia archaeon]